MLGASVAVLGLLGSSVVYANLSGSSFEGNDGNTVVNTTGNTDWNNVSPFNKGTDKPSGSGDNSFGQGTKEDNAAVTVVTGSIPPNKNDLTFFAESSENIGGNQFLYLAWERAVNIGNANLDFEINQFATAGFNTSTVGPVSLNRTAGDLLVTYDFSGSGTPTIGLNIWLTSASTPVVPGFATNACFSANSFPCWGDRQNLTGLGDAEAQVNTAPINDQRISGNSALGTGLFGEASINLTAAGVFPPNTCKALGTVFVKSRSSSSFTAEIKDFIAPVPVNVNTCGTITIHKVTENGDGTFGYTTSGSAPLGGGFNLSNGGTKQFTEVPSGAYGVTESSLPANWVLKSLTCTATGTGTSATPSGATVNITMAANGNVDCIYTNRLQLGAIKITKTSSKGLHPGLQGATFSIESGGSPITGSPFTTDSDGTVCVDGLQFGTYSVMETGAPTGYAIDDATAHDVTVDTNATCSDAHGQATFAATDTPLSQITVSFHSIVSGVTSATIQCTGDLNPQNLPDGTPRTLDNLVPGTYTCTVVIDP